MIENVFSEFEGNNWTKIACGNIFQPGIERLSGGKPI
jgi:hypothetical protein